ncbi:hypothetical protein AG1IA_06870 [Rhizoctonia solani AG-1 IA]|uniref:Uncharacterized protein n=1 Tax=Thanatephorus cucumeris (strain AG1-IA) TaxID=983506 RepID=L8WRT9_THACA|nr:hypothetical protein AG1IA_06870 [Rhizoctonia solani AG-1 IA]
MSTYKPHRILDLDVISLCSARSVSHIAQVYTTALALAFIAFPRWSNTITNCFRIIY